MVIQLKRVLLAILFLSSITFADSILIKNAKIHTLGAQGYAQ